MNTLKLEYEDFHKSQVDAFERVVVNDIEIGYIMEKTYGYYSHKYDNMKGEPIDSKEAFYFESIRPYADCVAEEVGLHPFTQKNEPDGWDASGVRDKTLRKVKSRIEQSVRENGHAFPTLADELKKDKNRRVNGCC